MSRRPAVVTQAEVARAVKGAIAGGMTVAKVEVDPVTGRIILTGPEAEAQPVDAYEAWKAGRPANG